MYVVIVTDEEQDGTSVFGPFDNNEAAWRWAKDYSECLCLDIADERKLQYEHDLSIEGSQFAGTLLIKSNSDEDYAVLRTIEVRAVGNPIPLFPSKRAKLPLPK